MSGGVHAGVPDHVVTACFHFLPAIVWTILTIEYTQLYLRNRPSRLFLLISAMSALMAAHWGIHGVIELTPTELGHRVPPLHEVLYVVIAAAQVAPAAIFRHLVPYMAIREEPPSRAWLLVNYGSGVAVLVLAAVLFFVYGPNPPSTWVSPVVPIYAYTAIVIPLGIVEMGRLRRQGSLPHTYDVHGIAFWTAMLAVPTLLGVLVLGGLGEILLAHVRPGPADPFDMSLLAHTTMGLVIASGFAVMILGEFLRSLVIGVAMIALAGLLFALPGFGVEIADPELRHLYVATVLLGIVLVIGPGLPWVQELLDRLVFHQSRRSREILERFLQTLSPEIGVLECCRRALAELARVTQVDGAAVLLDREESRTAAVGPVLLAPIESVWPTGEAAERLPVRAFGLYALTDPPLREAMAEAKISLVVPIRSPRRAWGHLFLTERLLGRTTRGEHHIRALEAFADRLGLVLDSAELLTRALEVERSLAHAERLAAIGELSARIAHEIRNPATAARSLAQQLVREPTPFARELEVILAELERIERQVSALLRYARREEFRFAPVDLEQLLRATADDLRSRIEAAGVAVRIEGPEELEGREGSEGRDGREGGESEGALTADADAEKIRQVLVNLIENALDALAGSPEPRSLTLRAARVNGTAQLCVTDNGRGAPAEVIDRLFEPFFSLKENGTGLGLAIARRVAEAHGGTLRARSPGPRGMTFELALPLRS